MVGASRKVSRGASCLIEPTRRSTTQKPKAVTTSNNGKTNNVGDIVSKNNYELVFYGELKTGADLQKTKTFKFLGNIFDFETKRKKKLFGL